MPAVHPTNPIPTEIPRDPVPPDWWGKDHWTTLAYAFRNAGKPLDHQHLRTAHPRYPTRLRDGAILSDHDDYDCLDDLEAAGVLVTSGTRVNPYALFSDEGLKLAQWIACEIDGGRGRSGSWTWPQVCEASGLDASKLTPGGVQCPA